MKVTGALILKRTQYSQCSPDVLLIHTMYSGNVEFGERKTNENVAAQNTSGVSCRDCGKTYKNKQSLNTHRYSCKVRKEKLKKTTQQIPIVSSGKPNLNPTSKYSEEVKPKRAYHRTAPPVQNRAHRCGVCSACMAQDCKTCKYCLDKAKYGGKNILKRPCMYRTCRNLIREKIDNIKEEVVKVDDTDDDIFNSDDEAYWKEFCEA